MFQVAEAEDSSEHHPAPLWRVLWCWRLYITNVTAYLLIYLLTVEYCAELVAPASTLSRNNFRQLRRTRLSSHAW